MSHVDENSNGATVDLTVGEVFEIQLAENPTTGFRWQVHTDGGPVCQPVDDRFESPSGPPGRGGVHVWRFRAWQNGAGQIDLVYRRSWETAAAKTFTLHVRVKA
jgi:inhibitor of cysteine peptidase